MAFGFSLVFAFGFSLVFAFGFSLVFRVAVGSRFAFGFKARVLRSV